MVHGLGGSNCDFCDLGSFRNAELFLETDLTFFACDAFGPSQVLPGGGIICPIAHRESPFELSPEEWTDTHATMLRAKVLLDQCLQPDGYNLIWNVKATGGQEVTHVHLHLIPRFQDEPFAGRGARWHLKQPDNRRDNLAAPGQGLARS